MMTDYVVGFSFNEARYAVILVQKQKPQWQRGLLNGVGGKIEKGEKPIEAMVREFAEEAGVPTLESDWTQYAIMGSAGFEDRFSSKPGGFRVHVFKTFNTEIFKNVTTVTDELIVTKAIDDVNKNNSISNLRWLIEMALDDNYGHPFQAKIIYGALPNDIFGTV